MTVAYRAAATMAAGLIFLFSSVAAWGRTHQDLQSRHSTRVLYVANTSEDEDVDPERVEDFRQFLERNFEFVRMTKDSEFQPGIADDVDVIILDGDITKRAGPNFKRPMILLGESFAPIRFAENNGYKLRNQCRTLQEKLYNVDTRHQVFNGPESVSISLDEDYDPVTGRLVRAWKSYRPFTHSQFRNHFAKGMTVSAIPLLDAADSEIIAGGMNKRGDHAIALAREANLFFWGLPASPRHMTAEAKKAFVNAVIYMEQFDGVGQSVRRGTKSRTRIAPLLRDLDHDMNRAWVDNAFPPEVVNRLGYDDVDAYRSLYLPNLDYVYVPPGTSGFAVDEDAKAVGIPNYDLGFLEKNVEMLERSVDAARAQRLLERYTGLSFQTAQDWKQWLELNRDKLYFSDSYGYRFYAGPTGPGPAERELQWAIWEMKPEQPFYFQASVDAVAVGYTLSQPGQAYDDKREIVDLVHQPGVYTTNKGGVMTLVVRLLVGDYAYVPAECPSEDEECKDVTFGVELPEGARWHGDWRRPAAYNDAQNGVAAYRGDTIFTRQLYFTSVPKDSRDVMGRALMKIPGTVQYQLCSQTENGNPDSPDRCRPPMESSFEAAAIVDAG